MKYCLLLICVFTGLGCFAQQKFNPGLKRQLDSIVVLDQKYREALSNLTDPAKAEQEAKLYNATPGKLASKLWVLQNRLDSVNVAFIDSVINKYGYPGTTMVGSPTNEAAWYVIQHSKQISKYINIIEQAANKKELPFTKYAMMYDRYLMNQHKEQVYGTQCSNMQLKNGSREFYVWPIADAAHVNRLRKKAGFDTTVEQSAASLDVVYHVVKLNEVKL